MRNATCVQVDPAALSPGQWTGKLAALCRDRGADDPEVRQCREALSYWRCRRIIDAELAQLSQPGVVRLLDVLRSAVAS